MNDEIRNENEFPEEKAVNEAENAAEQAIDTEPEVPSVEAEVVEEPKPASRPENPVYTQQSYTNAHYYSPSQQANYYSNNAQNYQTLPPKEKKDKKGLKVFAACLALVLVFALGFGVASINKSTDDNGGGINRVNEDAPDLNINSSPVTPTEVNVEGELTASQIHAKLSKSNVGIVVYAQNSNSSAGEGSGIIMGEDKSGKYTYIITCAHVINDAGVSVRVQTQDGTTYDATIVGFDTRTDLGVLRIEARGLPAAEFGDSNALRVGDAVYAIGNPGGIEFFGSLTGGYVSAIDRPVSSEIGYTMKCVQHSAAINPGNSGGMLVNAYGQVIGINSQKIAATDYEGMGFAIPVSSAKEIVESLISYGYVPNRPKLGISYYPVSSSAQYSMIAQIKGLPAGTLIINEIDSDSSLANTPIRRYDMITAVDGEPLTTADVLLERIDNGKVGDKMKLSICRVNSDYSIEEFDVEISLVEDKSASEPVTTTVTYIDPFEYFNQFGF